MNVRNFLTLTLAVAFTLVAKAEPTHDAETFDPACPGTEYIMGVPLFKKATMSFENGNGFVINAPKNCTGNLHVESLSLNGSVYTKAYLGTFDASQRRGVER